MTKRTAIEQKYWDRQSEIAAEHCLHRAKSINGCAHRAREAADAALAERRSSQRGAR